MKSPHNCPALSHLQTVRAQCFSPASFQHSPDLTGDLQPQITSNRWNQSWHRNRVVHQSCDGLDITVTSSPKMGLRRCRTTFYRPETPTKSNDMTRRDGRDFCTDQVENVLRWIPSHGRCHEWGTLVKVPRINFVENRCRLFGSCVWCFRVPMRPKFLPEEPVFEEIIQETRSHKDRLPGGKSGSVITDGWKTVYLVHSGLWLSQVSSFNKPHTNPGSFHSWADRATNPSAL